MVGEDEEEKELRMGCNEGDGNSRRRLGRKGQRRRRKE